MALRRTVTRRLAAARALARAAPWPAFWRGAALALRASRGGARRPSPAAWPPSRSSGPTSSRSTSWRSTSSPASPCWWPSWARRRRGRRPAGSDAASSSLKSSWVAAAATAAKSRTSARMPATRAPRLRTWRTSSVSRWPGAASRTSGTAATPASARARAARRRASSVGSASPKAATSCSMVGVRSAGLPAAHRLRDAVGDFEVADGDGLGLGHGGHGRPEGWRRLRCLTRRPGR